MKEERDLIQPLKPKEYGDDVEGVVGLVLPVVRNWQVPYGKCHPLTKFSVCFIVSF